MRKILILVVLFLAGCKQKILYVEVPGETVYVEVPGETVYVEVPVVYGLTEEPEQTLVSKNDKYINNYPVYERTFGNCNLVHEIIFYSTEKYYWVQKIGGCYSDTDYSDYFYLLIDRVYMPIGKAIEDGYITFEDFDKAHLGTKVEK